MTQNVGTIERAYQLARVGSCRSVDDIVRQLTAEKYESPQAHLAGKSLRMELRRLIKSRRDSTAGGSTEPESGPSSATA